MPIMPPLPEQKPRSETTDSDEDVRQNLETHLNDLVKQLLRKPAKSPKFNLDSPFVVTLLGGILLATLSAYLQYAFSTFQTKESIRSQAADRKEKLAYELANEFPVTLNLALRFKIRELWLTQHKGETNATYADGRSFVETRSYYEQLLDRYLLQKPTASLCNQILGSFTNAYSAASELNSNVDLLIGAPNPRETTNAFHRANVAYKEITKIIFTELNASP